jgi:hypothetical protein
MVVVVLLPTLDALPLQYYYYPSNIRIDVVAGIESILPSSPEWNRSWRTTQTRYPSFGDRHKTWVFLQPPGVPATALLVFLQLPGVPAKQPSVFLLQSRIASLFSSPLLYNTLPLAS